MLSRKAMCAMVIVIVCSLLGNPNASASVGKAILDFTQFIKKLFDPPPKPPVPIPRDPIMPLAPGKFLDLGNLPKKDHERLIGILKEYGDTSLPADLDEAVDTLWKGKIFPRVKEEWEFDLNELNKAQRETLERMCRRASLRSIKREDLPEKIIALGLDITKTEFVGKVLFVAKLANPELTREDALCLLRTQVTEEMLEQAVSTCGILARLSKCLKKIANKAPPAHDCQ